MQENKVIELSEFMIQMEKNKDLPNSYMTPIRPQLIRDFQKLETTLDVEIKKLFRYQKFEKDYCVQTADSPIRNLNLIGEGILCSYIYNGESTKNNIKEFYMPGDFAGNFNNYLLRNNSSYAIRTLSPVTCWSIDCQNLHSLMKTYNEVDCLVQYLNRIFMSWQDGTIAKMKILAPLDRYDYYLTHFAKYDDLINQEEIASFLGISRRTLNTFKKNSLKNTKPKHFVQNCPKSSIFS